MKVLLLVQNSQRVQLERYYQSVAACCSHCDIHRLDAAAQADLAGWFAENADPGAYDRIALFLRFKREIRQYRFLQTLPNLVFIEHDACQNYLPGKYRGRFSRHYRRLPWARIVSSGFGVAQKLRGEGFDAVFVPKGYDDTALGDDRVARDIELGFVGSTGGRVYRERNALLRELSQLEDVVITRSDKAGYRELLNRIRFFVSADVGLGEYMIKNFEAMACGCVLLAFDQGTAENAALGFEDMDNVVLYRSVAELSERLATLRANPRLAARIAERGRLHAESHHGWPTVAQRTVEALEAPLRRPRFVRRFGLRRPDWVPAESEGPDWPHGAQ